MGSSSPILDNNSNTVNELPKLVTDEPYFSRYQFFFDPPHLSRQAKSDRRFMQRMYREKAQANIRDFYFIGMHLNNIINLWTRI